MIIDLRSDTVTQPTPEMKEAMFTAELGDDVFGEDPTTKRLENTLAELFGMEAGLFCASGTMSNQIAIKAHTQPLDELICDKIAHIYNYEVGGWAFHSGISIRLTEGLRGKMTVAQIEELILPRFDWLPQTRMVSIENTVNKGGGNVYTVEEMKVLSDFCRERGLLLHLDGARIFNALVALHKKPADLKGMFDSISVCLSKGLGAPVGSVLLGGKSYIQKARRIRKVFGGGMRQCGILAAAGIYALNHHIERLKDDHRRAAQIAEALSSAVWVKRVFPTETNIVIFEVENAEQTVQRLAGKGIKTSAFSPTLVRMVTHLDINDEMTDSAIAALKQL